LPPLLVFTASPADRAAPQKLAYEKIARSAAESKTGPGVERARIRPLALLTSHLCTVHISAIRAQFCTIKKSPPVPRPLITPTNHYYLKEIGFASQNRAQSAPTSVDPRLLMARNQTTPPKIRILRPNREFAFSAASCPKCLPRRVHKSAQTQRRFPLAAPRITNEIDSHLVEIGFLSQKTPSASRRLHQRTGDNASQRLAASTFKTSQPILLVLVRSSPSIGWACLSRIDWARKQGEN